MGSMDAYKRLFWGLVGFAVLSWGLVVGETIVTGEPGLPTMANGVISLLMLTFYPLLAGHRVSAKTGQHEHARPCWECGSMLWPGALFCFRCGAFPKVRHVRHV